MEEKKIFKAISGVMSDIGSISKDRLNDKQKYKFRGIDDVYNALQPALIKHNVFCVPHVKKVHREERKTSSGGNLIYTVVDVDYTFYCSEDGSEIIVSMCGEGMDSGDKSLNKALSAAYKYCCLQLFCVPTEGENIDSEDHTYKVLDRSITQEEENALLAEAKRTGMNLSKAMKGKGFDSTNQIPVSVYTNWMTKMAFRETLPPPAPADLTQDIPDSAEGLPFK